MKFIYFSFLLFIVTISDCFSQDTTNDIFRIDKIPLEGILMKKGWKILSGDDSNWLLPSKFDCSLIGNLCLLIGKTKCKGFSLT